VENMKGWKATARRQLQRKYLENVNGLLNPDEAAQKVVANQQFSASDAPLYLMKNLQQVETFCQEQMKGANSLNVLHYEDLLRQVKLIRERRTTANAK